MSQSQINSIVIINKVNKQLTIFPLEYASIIFEHLWD